METNAEVSRVPCRGEEWAYRLRDDAPSERVHIVAVHQEGRRFRVDIRHMHGHPPGREENVPRSRLKVPWEDVVPYDAAIDGWRRLKAEAIDEHEASALWAALELLVPSEVAELSVASSDDSLTVHDHVAFEALTGQTVAAAHLKIRSLLGGESCLLHLRVTPLFLSDLLVSVKPDDTIRGTHV